MFNGYFDYHLTYLEDIIGKIRAGATTITLCEDLTESDLEYIAKRLSE